MPVKSNGFLSAPYPAPPQALMTSEWSIWQMSDQGLRPKSCPTTSILEYTGSRKIWETWSSYLKLSANTAAPEGSRPNSLHT